MTILGLMIVIMDLLKLLCMTLTILLCLITGVDIQSCRRCSWPRGEGADGKTKRLALLTPDKLTSDGDSCSASGACWAEQLWVEARTERGKPQVCKQRREQTSNQSCAARRALKLGGGKFCLNICYVYIKAIFVLWCIYDWLFTAAW